MLSGVFATVGTLSCTTWTIAGGSLNRYLTTGKSAARMNLIMGILIVATAGLILFG